MDVAFVSRFREHDRIFEQVDAEGVAPLHVGQSIPLTEGYCLKIVRGELPELISNTAEVPAAMAMPETSAIPIGSHMSVPIRLHTGDVYGTLCCFSYQADPTLGERDLKMVRAFAEVLASHIEERNRNSQVRAAKVDVVRRAMGLSSPRIVYQPIYTLRTGTLSGMECLSRFDAELPLSPNQWFDLAEEVDLRQDLELMAIRRALEHLPAFEEWVYFGVNSSPQTILSGALADVLKPFDLKRVVVEITEHSIVHDYDRLSAALQPLREQGLRLAIDDAGAGYASMRHIVSLLPDLIKLDMSLVRNIDRDASRRALAKAMISFSKEIGSRITAEGIETPAELETLRRLGVDNGQGYLLHKPVPLEQACQRSLAHYDINGDQIQLSIPE